MVSFRSTLLTAVVGAASLAGLGEAIPHRLPTFSKRQASGALSDTDILQFALTLEHLESAFYAQGFQKFPESDFSALGLKPEQIVALKKVGETEATHVTVLTDVLKKAGANPVQPCEYDFKFTTAADMVGTAKILEAVGVSAYLGAAPLVQSKDILAAAASIVTVEARHQTFIRAASGDAFPVPQAFDAALGPQSVFTLASQFIKSCPEGSNLAFTAFPSLVIVNAQDIKAGTPLNLATGSNAADAKFCAFTAGGVGTVFAPLNNGACTVPDALAGEVYVQLTKSGDGNKLDESTVVAAGGTGRWIEVSMTNCMGSATRPETLVWRPNDFLVPVKLCNGSNQIEEDDPGSIFEFLGPWNAEVKESEKEVVIEFRSSAAIGEELIKYSATQPLLNLESSFIEWENAIILGHPTYPFHRNWVPDKALSPLPPSEIFRIIDPTISLLLVPRCDVRVYGEFESLTKPLLESFGINCPAPEDQIIVPCHAEQVPGVLEDFPRARIIKSVRGRAKCQSSIRTVTITNYKFDLKFSLGYRIGSVYRQFGGPNIPSNMNRAKLLSQILPENMWVLEDIAGVTGNVEKMDHHSACRLACVVRENLTSKADARGEALIVSAALMEKPYDDCRTYAEILFGLDTKAKKVEWFTSYIKCLLPLALHPQRYYGISLEAHAQNMVARFSRSTGEISGFAIRDMGGVRGHTSTLEKHGLLTDDLGKICIDDMDLILDKTHETLIQNNIGYLLYTLGLEESDNGSDIWEIVRSVLSETLDVENDATGSQIYKHFTKEKMPFKCYLRRRMAASFRETVHSAEDISRDIPNHIAERSPC
ncbi:hypothetical protein ABW20_dc0107822 [Dactylellina cionopaga]|nr:hypothetical protein ABW20_dc0107822 [Dactylellina cionopaga]